MSGSSPEFWIRIRAQFAQFVSQYFYLSMRQLIGNSEQTSLTNFLFQEKGYLQHFCFRLIWIPSPTVILHMKATQKEERLRER
jgi:hypothetical protein